MRKNKKKLSKQLKQGLQDINYRNLPVYKWPIELQRRKWIMDMHNGVLTNPLPPDGSGDNKPKRGSSRFYVSVPIGGQNGKKHH